MILALYGGKPVRETFLPYGQQWITEEDIEAIVATLKSPNLTQGPAIEKFEQAIADYVDTKYAVAFCNGTAALHAACYAADITKGDEVITTPMTFAATANSVLYMGAIPVFADINKKTYNIDPTEIRKKLTTKTKAIIAVDYTGQPCDIDGIKKIAKENNLVFIEDAAHSLGSSYKGKKVGSQADMTMFSFHPVKHITTGEGGIIVTNSEEYAKKLRLFRSHGITKEHLAADTDPWYYEMIDLGMNYRMTDIQASLGYSQLQRLDQFIKRRKEIVTQYNSQFEQLNGVCIPFQDSNSDSSWHLYMLRLYLEQFTVNRRTIFDALRAENIGVHVHYIPVHTLPYYQQLGYKKGICLNAENYYKEAITLPVFPNMSEADVDSVIEAVSKVIKFFTNERGVNIY